MKSEWLFLQSQDAGCADLVGATGKAVLSSVSLGAAGKKRSKFQQKQKEISTVGPVSPVVSHLKKCPADFAKVLAEFPLVVNKDALQFSSKPAHGVSHHILTEGPPITAKARRLDPEKLAAAKKEFAAMEAAGIIRRSDSAWASPLHLVKKADGSWRPTGDYRRLNRVTVPDNYPVPNILDFSANLAGKRFFSRLT